MRRIFAVGRVDGKTTEIRVVKRRGRALGLPFASGPFQVAAVVRPTGAPPRPKE